MKTKHPKTEFQREKDAKYIADGFTLFDDAKPEIGKAVEAVRVFQPTGFGGVILGTTYKIVPITRTCDLYYTDTLNEDKQLPISEFEAWRELQTYAPAETKTDETAEWQVWTRGEGRPTSGTIDVRYADGKEFLNKVAENCYWGTDSLIASWRKA